MTFPLFVVTGNNCSGKSTTAKELKKILIEFNVYDMDLIVNRGHYQTACNNWVRIAYSNALGGRGTILFGNAPIPYNVEICDHASHFKIHYLHLYCNEKERTKRLTTRSEYTPEKIQFINEESKKLLKKAQNMVPPIPIIDTSTTPVSQIAKDIKKWILSNSP